MRAFKLKGGVPLVVQIVTMNSNTSQELGGAYPNTVSSNSGFPRVFEGDQELGGGILCQPSEPENPDFENDCSKHRQRVDVVAVAQHWGCYDAPHRVHVAQ